MRLLLVEDDELVVLGLRQALAQSGYTVDATPSAEVAESLLALEDYDLAIVDLGLPTRDGLDLIRSLRTRGEALPVLILSARDGMQDLVGGLDAGADDYLTKPFRLPELVARVRALIRRVHFRCTSELRHGALRFDTATHAATLAGEPVELTRREWAILEILLTESPKVVTKQRLLQALCGWDKDITPNTVEVHVSRIRAKLLQGGIEIRTVRGIGYRLDAPAE